MQSEPSFSDRLRKSLYLLPLFFAEIAGTATLISIGCLACTNQNEEALMEPVAVCFGAALHLAIEIYGSISGGHFNPAVSLSVLVLGKLSIIQFLLYVIAQFLGGFLGYGLLFWLLPVKRMSLHFCSCKLKNEVTVVQGFFLEALFTAGWGMVICALLDLRNVSPGKTAALRIGFILLGSVFALYPYTNACLNPARALPTAIFNKYYENHWLFHVGPFVGGIFGGLFYRYVFDASEIRSVYTWSILRANFSSLM